MTENDLLKRFTEVNAVKINDIIWNVDVCGDMVTLTYKKNIKYIAKSDLHKHWFLKNGKLHYYTLDFSILPFAIHRTTSAEI